MGVQLDVHDTNACSHLRRTAKGNTGPRLTTFGASLQSLEWTVNGYVLAYAVLLLTGAALGDRLGRKRMFIAGLALFTGASARCRPWLPTPER